MLQAHCPCDIKEENFTCSLFWQVKYAGNTKSFKYQNLFASQQRYGYMNSDNTLERTHIQPQKIFLFIKGIQNHGVFLGHVGNNHPNYIHTFLWDKNVKYSPISRLKRIPVWVERCQRRGFKWCLWENVFTQKLMKQKIWNIVFGQIFMHCLEVRFFKFNDWFDNISSC